jgi:hypothetical protein
MVLGVFGLDFVGPPVNKTALNEKLILVSSHLVQNLPGTPAADDVSAG